MNIEQLLQQMTLSEKVTLCHAASKFSVAGIERLSIPDLTMSDGPHGVRCEISKDSWDPVDCDWDYGTYLPTGTALAATWSRDLARRFGEILGAEARDRGKDVILGPGINIVRNPICGRNFEYYGEDPYHIAELVMPAIQGIQSQGTAACVKHYALNNQELNRHGVDARIDERALREIYLPGFEAAVKQGGVLTVMGAYNLFRGQHCCHNDYLLNVILKGEWGFEGAVISDWSGTHDTLEAARHGLDIEMGTHRPYGEYFLAQPFEDATRNGTFDEDLATDKARRVLFTMQGCGMFNPDRPRGERNSHAHQDDARKIAEEAIVLLQNENQTLPLKSEKITKILVLGENATRKHHAGGNSSAVKALYEVTPLEGIRALVGNICEVEYLQGYPDTSERGQSIPTEQLGIADSGAGTRGWIQTFYNNTTLKGEPYAARSVAEPELDFENDLPEGLTPTNFSCRFEANFTPDNSGIWTFHLHGCPHATLDIDGVVSIIQLDPETPTMVSKQFHLEASRTYNLRIHVTPMRQVSPRHIHLLTEKPGVKHQDNGQQQILEKAAQADAVLFFGGLNHLYDLECCDRPDMQLHDGQNQLIEALADQTDKLAVILVNGSPIEMPWVDKVPAIVQMWYAGMEGGHAIANTLFGKNTPSGKLPFTFPQKLKDSAANCLNDYHEDICDYKEGIFVGYRWFEKQQIDPLFAFGHGLSYTTFKYHTPEVRYSPSTSDNRFATVTCQIENTGNAPGKEVSQLYITDDDCTVQRPVKELKGFQKVHLEPGEQKEVELNIYQRDLQFYHPTRRQWELEPGTFTILIGSSSQDIRQTCQLQVDE